MKQNKLNRTVGITFLSQDIAYVAVTGLQKTAALPYALSGFIFPLYAKECRDWYLVKVLEQSQHRGPCALGIPGPVIAALTPERWVGP